MRAFLAPVMWCIKWNSISRWALIQPHPPRSTGSGINLPIVLQFFFLGLCICDFCINQNEEWKKKLLWAKKRSALCLISTTHEIRVFSHSMSCASANNRTDGVQPMRLQREQNLVTSDHFHATMWISRWILREAVTWWRNAISPGGHQTWRDAPSGICQRFPLQLCETELPRVFFRFFFLFRWEAWHEKESSRNGWHVGGLSWSCQGSSRQLTSTPWRNASRSLKHALHAVSEIFERQ